MQKLIINFLLFTLIFPYPNNPPNAVTGAPGEGTCRNCHTSYALNSGSGDVEILGIPNGVIPGETYQLQVKVSHPTLTRWGFEVATKFSNNTQAGSFDITDNTHTLSGVQSGITYIKQRSAGTYSGQSESATWDMDWTAPGMITSDITFYAAGLTSNSANGNSGDYVYTTSFSTTEGEEIVDVDYATEIQPIFNANCTSCHGSSGGLSLSSYSTLKAGNVVVSGNGTGSLLIKKLKGEAGTQMPKGNTPLEDATINLIITWIDEGALDN
jgi:mono/diheme cytochrome c family protein